MADTKEKIEDSQDGSEFDLSEAIAQTTENSGGDESQAEAQTPTKDGENTTAKKVVKGKAKEGAVIVQVDKADLDALMAGYKRLESKVEQLEEAGKVTPVDGEEPLIVHFRMYNGKPITKFTHSYDVEYGEGIGRYTIPHVDVFVHGSDEKITMRTEDFYQLTRKEFQLSGDTATAITRKQANVGTGLMNESKYDEEKGEMVSTGRRVPNKVMADKLTFSVLIDGEPVLVEDAYINA